MTLLTFTAFAQEPSYETYGSEQLSGLTVYDQLMSSDEILYIATSDGVFAYNSITFQKLDAPKGVKGKAYFGLQKNERNQIFCSNLNGQVFEISDNSLELFYELPDSLVGVFTMLTIVDEGIIINARNPILVDWDGKRLRTLGASFASYFSDELISSKLIDNLDSIELGVHSRNGYDAEPLYSMKIPFRECIIPLSYRDGCYYFQDNCLHQIIAVDFRNSTYKTTSHNSSIQQNILLPDKTFWAKLAVNGIVEFGANVMDSSQFKYYYQNIYAAPQAVNEHGIFLGSDGNGIYQVKNKFLYEYPELNLRNDLRKIIKGPDEQFIIQTKDEILLLSKDFVSRSIFKLDAPISYMHYSENNKKLFVGSHDRLYTYEFDSGKDLHVCKFGSNIKSLFEVTGDTVLYAGGSAIGRYKIGPSISQENHIDRVRSNSCIRINNNDYFGTYHGLWKFKRGSNKSKTIKYKGDNILATRLFQFQDRMLIYSIEHGVLQYENDRISPMKIPDVKKEDIHDVYFDYPYLSIATKKMLVIQNLVSGEQFQFTESDGLKSLNIKHALIDNQTLYLLTDKGLQSVALSRLIVNDTIPHIRISTIFLNDKVFSKRTNQFEYWQNKMSFEIIGNAFGKQKNTSYKYQLEGLSGSTWYYKDYYDNSVAYQALPPGEYTFRVVPIYKGREGKEVRYSFTIYPPFWQAWWFYVLLVGVGVLSALFIYRIYSLRRYRKVQLESQINKLRLQAIQSQMNPHFIFNSINAIQESVLNHERKSTYQHINKFSKLVRLTLNFSNEEMITLEEEVELLQLYLDLEKIRFPEDFEFEIKNSANTILNIPPMLVQPFVENAILHGLFHKKGKKKVTISIEEKDHLLITIEDNGIGRAASEKINHRKKRTYEKSFAINAVQDRIVILKRRYGEGAVGVDFVDLFDEEGNPAGTLVTLKLPVILDL